MKRIKFATYLIVLAGTIIFGLNILARVSSARDFKALNSKTSQEYPIAVVMAYTSFKGMEKGTRNALREAQSGFSDASSIKTHKALRGKIKYTKVNLDAVPAVADEYGLNKDPEIITLLIFKDGKKVSATYLRLTENTTEDSVSSKVQDILDDSAGYYINRIIDDYVEHKKDLEIARAERDYYYVDPWYSRSPWWDYYYHGYYDHHYRRRPGFGFYINVD